MAKKFPEKCKVCGEIILMVRYSRGWKSLDFPDNSLTGKWSKHMHLESKKWIWNHLDRNIGGEF